MVEHPQDQGVEDGQEQDAGHLLVPQGHGGEEQDGQGQPIVDQGVVDPGEGLRSHGQPGDARDHKAVGEGDPVDGYAAYDTAQDHIEQGGGTVVTSHKKMPSCQGTAVPISRVPGEKEREPRKCSGPDRRTAQDRYWGRAMSSTTWAGIVNSVMPIYMGATVPSSKTRTSRPSPSM